MNELHLEELAIAWFKDIGYQTLHGPDIEPGGSAQERAEYQDVILWDRFDAALARLKSSLLGMGFAVLLELSAGYELPPPYGHQSVFFRRRSKYVVVIVDDLLSGSIFFL